METERERLDDDRESITKDYRVFGYKLKVILGYNVTGNLKEIQMYMAKRGSIIHGHVRTISFLISKLLQYNVGIESLASRLETQNYLPNGFAEGEQFNSIDHFVADILRKNKKHRTINGEKCEIQDPKPEEKD